MKHQRGLTLIALGIYVLVIAAVVSAAAAFVYTYNEGVRAKAQLDSIEAELKDCDSEDRAKGLAECVKTVKTRYSGCLGSISAQNDSLKVLAKERDDAVLVAKGALDVAKKAIAVRKTERERLAALERDAKGKGVCPAGDAVREFRKGLKP